MPAHDDVIVKRDAHWLGDCGDILGHPDIGGGGGRIAGWVVVEQTTPPYMLLMLLIFC